jgi:hypothetical protein
MIPCGSAKAILWGAAESATSTASQSARPRSGGAGEGVTGAFGTRVISSLEGSSCSSLLGWIWTSLCSCFRCSGVPVFQLEDELLLQEGRDVMYHKTLPAQEAPGGPGRLGLEIDFDKINLS